MSNRWIGASAAFVSALCGASCMPDARAPLDAPASRAQARAMVAIAGAATWIGSPDGVGAPQEHPRHQVSVAPFQLDEDLVTSGAYEACVRAGGCSPAGQEQRGAPDSPEQRAFCTGGRADRSGHPINCVDFAQASAFCAWEGKRLPTEEEWELAAKGPTDRPYPWGAEPPADQLCWRRLSGEDYVHGRGTCPVGAFPAGRAASGARDMVGNVWVWTSTPFRAAYGKPVDPTAHVVRGAGWRDTDASLLRPASRNGSTDTDRVINLGFRCAR